MGVAVARHELRVMQLRTRLPFRYGIAVMTELPQLFVDATVVVDGNAESGVAADNCPPKWFTKDPATSAEDDVANMFRVVDAALTAASQLGEFATPFDLWRALDAHQARWAENLGYPPLLWGFGVSLVERAVINAFCRAHRTRFDHAVLRGELGIDLGAIYPELQGRSPADFLPSEPLRTLTVRHTVGLGDPLEDADIGAADRVGDGLPESLDEAITHYGLRRLKVKLSGACAFDIARLQRLETVLSRHQPRPRLTLDGNEQFTSMETFRDYWDTLIAAVPALTGDVTFVEQPVLRDHALEPQTAEVLSTWPSHPMLIIDESDDRTGRLIDALQCGYRGTSHKNCKGVFRGIANASLVRHRNRTQADGLVITGEDLANVGPVSLLQDLAVMGVLGVEDVERNGHFYFAGVSMFPESAQQCLLKHHADLFHVGDNGVVQLRISDGSIDVGSVLSAPFGSWCTDFVTSLPVLALPPSGPAVGLGGVQAGWTLS